jgi:hypothetical protein
VTFQSFYFLLFAFQISSHGTAATAPPSSSISSPQ